MEAILEFIRNPNNGPRARIDRALRYIWEEIGNASGEANVSASLRVAQTLWDSLNDSERRAVLAHCVERYGSWCSGLPGLSAILGMSWTHGHSGGLITQAVKQGELDLAEVVDLFEFALTQYLMDPESLSLYERRSKTLQIYRGSSPKGYSGAEGMSWTLNPSTAAWFALGTHWEQPVLQGQVRDQDTLAVFGANREQELVVRPGAVTEITPLKETPQEILFSSDSGVSRR